MILYVLKLTALAHGFHLFKTSKSRKNGVKAEQHFVVLHKIDTFYSDTTYFLIFIKKKSTSRICKRIIYDQFKLCYSIFMQFFLTFSKGCLQLHSGTRNL